MSSIPLNGSTFHVLTLQEPLLLVIRTELHLSQVPPRIIIRSEYLRAYEDLLADGRSASRKYVVTGQPGIGKTGFAAFVLLKRLGERLTTVVQNREMEYILFDENGAWPQSCSANIPRIALPPTSWVLADSHSKSVYPDGLFWGNFNVVVVQTASPAQRRWREWLKEADAQFYIMDLWSISELTALMLLLESNVQDGLAIAIKYGRCARYVVEMTAAGHFAPNAVEKHEKDLSQAAIALARCRVTIPDQSDFGWRSEENYASSILFLRPEGYDRIHCARPVFFFPTEYVLGVLAKRPLQVSLKNKNRLFGALATRPSTSSAAGWIFENFVHAYFPVGPIILMDANGNAHRSIMTNTHILVGKVDDLQRKIQDREQKLPFYFRPTQSNFPGIDAVFVSSICVLAIQATVSSRHKKLNQGLEKVIDCLGIGRSRDQLKLIFVGPTMDKVSHLCRSITLEPMQGLAVPIYGCVLPLGLRHSDNAIQRNLEDAVTIPRSLEPDG